jgi:hypothetical protein
MPFPNLLLIDQPHHWVVSPFCVGASPSPPSTQRIEFLGLSRLSQQTSAAKMSQHSGNTIEGDYQSPDAGENNQSFDRANI